MTKNKTTAGVIVGVGLILFNVIFFALPVSKDASFWISYSFGMVALIGQTAICFLAWNKATSIKSKFMGVPILIVGYRFLVFQLISSFVFLGFAISPIKVPFFIPLIIDTIILGVCIIFITVIDVARDEINRVEENVKQKVFYIKSLQADVEMLTCKVDNVDLKKSLIDLSEKIKYSDPMTNVALSSLENEIASKISQLKDAILVHDYDTVPSYVDEIMQMLEERNKKCKLFK